MRQNSTRRVFLGSTAATATTLLTRRTAAASQAGANDAVRVGIIGCGGRGSHLLRQFQDQPEARVVAVCDVLAERRERAREQAGGSAVLACNDFREILDRKDVDAVAVATPGHWHVLPTVLACQAGKDVYVEKPLGTSIAEGRAAVSAARKYERIVQLGTQQHNWDIYRKAVEVIRSGKLGEISMVEVWDNENHSPGYGAPPDGSPPPGLDWEMYLGPAPKRAYNPNRFAHHYWFIDYGGGWPLDWAVHHYDIVHWAMDVTAPVSAVATGGRLALGTDADNREWPDTLTGALEYGPGPVAKLGFVLQYTTRCGGRGPAANTGHGKAFYGTEASLILDRAGYTLTAEGPRGPGEVIEQVQGETEYQAVTNHVRAFLDAVRSRKRPVSDVEVGHHSTNPGHLLNLAWRTGRKLRWDAAAERFIDDPEADALLSRTYRSPWTLSV